MLGLWCDGCRREIDSSDGTCPDCGAAAFTDEHPTPSRSVRRSKLKTTGALRKSLSDPLTRRCAGCGQVKKHKERSDRPGRPQSRCPDCMKTYLVRYRRESWARVKARNTWKGMINRCHSPGWGKNCPPGIPRYRDYGAKGVRVCKRWRESFTAFLKDMGLPPARDSTLDRKNPQRNYTPSNCKWVTPGEQHANRKNTRWVTAWDPAEQAERTRSLSDWQHASGIDRRTIAKRLDRGWEPNRAVSQPTPRMLEAADPVPF